MKQVERQDQSSAETKCEASFMSAHDVREMNQIKYISAHTIDTNHQSTLMDSNIRHFKNTYRKLGGEESSE